MDYRTIRFEKNANIALITLNRPNETNSLNLELLGELGNALTRTERDSEVKVAIIAGSEKYFATGVDLSEIKGITTPVEAHQYLHTVHAVFDRLDESKKPSIAAISGMALGGGCELTLACDLRIAAENAIFGQPEIKIGLMPGAGATQRLPRVIGVTRAKELLYTGDFIDAQEAFRIGLVNRVVPTASLMDEARKMAMKLAAQPGFALEMIKRAVEDGMNMNMRSGLAYEARCFEMLYSTDDRKEGIKAFIEKRKPSFVGR